ncbi:alcohol dehydrogenase catalytic domain-containing protein [Agromyces aerolatus]|uniref:alcohol dehydrogenase catalytic domain-containing protein n=1 Tax=Agromyces sp. LY-1074 TaxID=3074080 RepID=UPI0028670454|nr:MULTISPECIES: alcohol dehydrogenase catalytic domain-containing protein [unclassified Agromyces]MDR5698965.1 alcohol dehydrogenase catalytic domain-containing protein [Agromyces sp. LY-1074]MDR5705257.1 alcohol dehydrogenase catalytic domain-containing protein [Agromyces sp. LY-1358]
MRALTWQSTGHVSVETVPDPTIEDPKDVVIRVTSTAICGSDLHLYGVLGPFLDRGDILGHEAMGVVEAVGSEVRTLAVGDRVVVPFVIACGECAMCRSGLTTQCEVTQNREHGTGADLYGYTELYGSVPGGQAEYLRVRRADANAYKVGHDLPDDRYLFLSDILPTAWQGVQYANLPDGGTLGVLGLGPVGQFAARIGRHLGHRVIAVDPVPERRLMAERYGIETLDVGDDTLDELRALTSGRGPDSIVDAVGLEAHGNPSVEVMQKAVGILPDVAAKPIMQHAGVDRLAALTFAIDAVRRGGTVSLSGVYAGAADPLPMMTMFDKQLALRMGQCNVHAWRDELLPLVEDPADPLGTEDLTTHRVPLERAPEMYETFQKKEHGCIKVVLKPGA